MPTDPYSVLGVSRDATPDEIKSAYRRLARQYHPDVNPGDAEAEERFKEIGQAYAVLSDEDRRAQYDRYGTVEEMPNGFGFEGSFTDLFDAFFGGMGGPASRSRGLNGQDLTSELSLTLLDVLRGGEFTVRYRRPARCSACDGSGAAPGSGAEECTTCGGQGVVSRVQNTILGQVRTSATCSACRGEGTIIREKCPTCRGGRLVEEEASVVAKVPKGVDDGATLRIAAKGGDGLAGGRSGDLYVVLRVEPDSRFERHGTDLLAHVGITFAQAALGVEIEVDGLDDVASLDIPPGTQPGTRFRIRGRGLPPLHGGARGDLYVDVEVEVPTKLDEEQAELVRQLSAALGEEVPKPGSKGLGGLFKRKK